MATSSNNNLTGDRVKEEISDLVAKAVSEEKDKEKRRPNLMIFSVPEIISADRKVRVKHDTDMFEKVLNLIMVLPDLRDKISRIIRTGRFDSESAMRPIKVIFKEIDTKYKFLQKAYKLKDVQDDQFKDVRISDDRTPQQIRKYRDLRSELERRKALGEENLKIQGGKIVPVNITTAMNEQVAEIKKVGANKESTYRYNVASSDSDHDEVLSEESTGLEKAEGGARYSIPLQNQDKVENRRAKSMNEIFGLKVIHPNAATNTVETSEVPPRFSIAAQ